MLNLNIGNFKCQLHGKHILGDKRFVVQFFSSTIANKDFPLELHVKLMLTTTVNPIDLDACGNTKSHSCFHVHDVQHREFNMVAMEVFLLPILEGH